MDIDGHRASQPPQSNQNTFFFILGLSARKAARTENLGNSIKPQDFQIQRQILYGYVTTPVHHLCLCRFPVCIDVGFAFPFTVLFSVTIFFSFHFSRYQSFFRIFQFLPIKIFKDHFTSLTKLQPVRFSQVICLFTLNSTDKLKFSFAITLLPSALESDPRSLFVFVSFVLFHLFAQSVGCRDSQPCRKVRYMFMQAITVKLLEYGLCFEARNIMK